MSDRIFFRYAIQIFESYVFLKKPESMDVYDNIFWSKAIEIINKAINKNPKIIILLKLIYFEEKIDEKTLLNLLFSTICKTKSLNFQIMHKPDDWGSKLIWPFYENSLVKLEDWAPSNIVKEINNAIEINKLTEIFNQTAKAESFAAFPRTYKNIGRYYGA